MLDPGAQGLLDALHEPYLLVDAKGRIAAANRCACRLLGRAQLAGQDLETLLAPTSEPLAELLRRCRGSGESTLGSLVVRDDAQKVLRVEGSRFVAGGQGDVLSLLHLSSRRAAATQFAALNRQLDELGREVARRQHAEARLAAKVAEMEEEGRHKNRFIALLSHELRNPLAPIRMLLHMLRLDPSPDVALPRIEIIERHVMHLIRLVDDLLDLSRIANGKIRVETVDVALADVVEMAASGVRPRIDAKRQLLEVAVPRGLAVRADPDRLRQVVGNILDNASKFTPENGRITVTAAAETGRAVIRVRDSGPGVAPELSARVFDFFSQGDAIDRAHGGLGLGLGLAKSLIELQGGSITLAPPCGAGAEFVVTVPALDGAMNPPASGKGRRLARIDAPPAQ